MNNNIEEINVLEKIVTICKELDELDDYLESLNSLYSEMDCRLCDLYHIIEFEELTPTQARKLTREMQKVLLLRRKVKNDISINRVYTDNIDKIKKKDTRPFLLEKLHKTDKTKLDMEYKNRVYTNEELNKIIGTQLFDTETNIIKQTTDDYELE